MLVMVSSLHEHHAVVFDEVNQAVLFSETPRPRVGKSFQGFWLASAAEGFTQYLLHQTKSFLHHAGLRSCPPLKVLETVRIDDA